MVEDNYINNCPLNLVLYIVIYFSTKSITGLRHVTTMVPMFRNHRCIFIPYLREGNKRQFQSLDVRKDVAHGKPQVAVRMSHFPVLTQ